MSGETGAGGGEKNMELGANAGQKKGIAWLRKSKGTLSDGKGGDIPHIAERSGPHVDGDDDHISNGIIL